MLLIWAVFVTAVIKITHAQFGATVTIQPTTGQQTAGTLRLTRAGHGVNIKGVITGLHQGKHGFHVHASGNLGNDCADALGHFNPFQRSHGGSNDRERHAGDLGNIIATPQGTANVDITDFHISLDSKSDVFIGGLAIVIHAGMDDLGRGGNDESLRTGNAGARIGCGVIQTDTPPHSRGQSSSIRVSPSHSSGRSSSHSSSRGPPAHSSARIPVVSKSPSQQQQIINPEVSRSQQIPAPHGVHRAFVEMVPGVNKTSGSLSVMPNKGGILIKGKIFGLSPGLHGFHVHQNGRTGNTCADAGGHFNPFQRSHGSPNSQERHVGDLGNIHADQFGVAVIEVFDDHASLDPLSPAYVGGRAFVVHVAPDDLGQGPNEESRSTGNAGARAGCGVIRVIPDESSSFSSFPFHDEAFSSSFGAFHGSSAKANIIPGSEKVTGSLEITEDISGVRIKGIIEGLTPGLHGFHVHANGALTNKCVDAGGHFNPLERTHGDPKSRERHAGDLGNILADDRGVAKINIKDDHISLDPSEPTFIGEKAFVVHASPDDLGRGRNEESLRTGNAGSRVGCGLIEMKNPSTEFHSSQPGFPGQPSNQNQKFQVPASDHDFASQSRQEHVFPAIQVSGFDVTKAVAIIVPGSDMKIRGSFELIEKPGGVTITGKITGLTPGAHGFHVHQTGLLGNGCVDAGGHFNPFENSHGDPKGFNRHVGDLGNIVADDKGIAFVNIFDSHISLDPHNPAYIGGRAFVIHAKPDDLGRGQNEESLRTGNAGARLGCARILVEKADHQDQTNFPTNAEAQSSNIKPTAHATVKIIPGGDPNIQGTLELTADGNGVIVEGQVRGLTPGLHGFHVHQRGDLGNKCVDAGGHFNPFQKNHGSPRDQHRHVGDLGNIEADQNGIAKISFRDTHISLDPKQPSFIGGRAFVVHEKADDLGRGGNDGSLKTGNAGSRLGCGRIEMSVNQQSSISVPFNQQAFLPSQGNSGNIQPKPDISSFQHQTFPGSSQTHSNQQGRQSLNNPSKLAAYVAIVPGKDNLIRGGVDVLETRQGVLIRGVIEGLTPGFHGFHVHQNGALGNQCSDAGGHFNPFQRNHGSPNTNDRHVGDLGNIYADRNGRAVIEIVDTHISMNPDSQAYIGGRAIVVHADPDDLGQGRNADSLKTGNAGSRLGCGLVDTQVGQEIHFPELPRFSQSGPERSFSGGSPTMFYF